MEKSRFECDPRFRRGSRVVKNAGTEATKGSRLPRRSLRCASSPLPVGPWDVPEGSSSECAHRAPPSTGLLELGGITFLTLLV